MGFNETNGEYGIYIMGIHDWRITEHQLEKNWNPCELRGIIQWNIPVKRCVMP